MVTRVRYLAHKLEFSFSLSWKSDLRGRLTDLVGDAVRKNLFQRKLTYSHLNKGKEMAPKVGSQGGTLLHHKLPAAYSTAVEKEGPVGVYILLYGDERDTKYIIRSISESSLGHGFECRNESRNVHPRSFLFFSLWEEAERARRCMSMFSDESIIKCFSVIKHMNAGYWLAIEKVDHHLLKDGLQAWCPASLKVTPRCILLLRSITRAMLRVTEAGLFHGRLEDMSVLMVKNRAKLALIGENGFVGDSTLNGPHLSTFFGKLLWEGRGSVEVRHFLYDVRTEFVRKLEFHPLLMNSTERLYFPVAVYMWLSELIAGYGSKTINSNLTNIHKIYLRSWKDKVDNDKGPYGKVFAHCTYIDGFKGHIKYMRHVAVHFTDHKFQVATREDLEHELSIMFPHFLTDLYDVLKMEDFKNMALFIK